MPLTKIRLPVEVTWQDPVRGREVFGIPQDRFVFMVAFDVGSTAARKNPRMVVDAFREAFPDDENVFLVIKFHSTAVEPAVTRQLTQALRGADNVLVISDLLSESDMGLLRAACDCFVSAHRSEGFWGSISPSSWRSANRRSRPRIPAIWSFSTKRSAIRSNTS